MDKLVEPKRTSDSNPVERFLKHTPAFKDYIYPSDAREQKIEKQIEEYKRKREKVFADQSNRATFPLTETRKKESQENTFAKPNLENIKMKEVNVEETIKTKTEDDEKVKEEEEEEEDEEEEEEQEDEGEEGEEEEEDIRDKEYLSKLKKLKLQLEEAKIKEETLQMELEKSCNEEDLKRLARILGEKEKDLQVGFYKKKSNHVKKKFTIDSRNY